VKVTIFGAGYVGLITGVCLAEIGHQVKVFDIDDNKIALMQQGECPIYEPNLPELLAKNLQLNRISFTNNSEEAVEFGEVHFIAVGTPPQDKDGAADLQYVNVAAETIGKYLSRPSVVINKSTVPVGTLNAINNTIKKNLKIRQIELNFSVVSNPEFLKQGEAINDFFNAARIVIGTDDEKALAVVKELYSPLISRGQKFIVMDIASAELTKYAANVFLAAKISFINELSRMAMQMGADIERIRAGIGSDPRIGDSFLRAGCGFGGSCFPKDLKALINMADEISCESLLLDAVNRVNDAQKNLIFYGINKYFGGNLQDKTVALWGLAFKPNTDDMREAPSRILMESLWRAGCHTKCYDPAAMAVAQKIYGEQPLLSFGESQEEVLDGCDILVIITEWSEFKSPNFDVIKQKLKYPVIFDGRNLFEPEAMEKLGIEYFCIGRGKNWLA
jgi:UDPglucose 6-dehydrogenase